MLILPSRRFERRNKKLIDRNNIMLIDIKRIFYKSYKYKLLILYAFVVLRENEDFAGPHAIILH